MTELVDPQLEGFFASNPEILQPGAITPSPRVPAWYDNTVVELAGAFIAVRGLVALSLARAGAPPSVGQAQAIAGQAWRHHAPAWMRFAVPAIQQAYRAGRITGLSDSELEAMASDYAEGLGEYLSDSSGEALADGFETQLAGRWDSSLAWHRISSGYGLDTPGMRSYVRTVLAQPEGQRDLVGPAARTLADRLILERAQRVAENEAWTASQSGLTLSWIIKQRRGEISPDATRRWRTRHGETVCAICGPMDGVTVALDQPFVLVDGTQLLAPAAHPGCQCTQELVEPLVKAAPAVTVAGLALVAADTGRVLMLQRANDPKDPAGGMWEFPGGHLEDGEAPLDGARREWEEEVRRRLPAGARPTGSWTSGIYQGFVVEVPDESCVPSHRRGRVSNPDDPDGDQVEAIAWWDPAQLPGNRAVRPELRRCLPFVRRALAGRTVIAKAKKLDDGTLDPYDRTKKGKFARHEERTRVVTHLADPIVLTPEAQAIIDQVKQGVRNPFEQEKRTNPFAKSPFASSGANPFAAKANPFAAPAANPFAAKTGTKNPFDQTKKPAAEQRFFQKKRLVIHHVFAPRKSAEAKEDLGPRGNGYYASLTELIEPYEQDTEHLAQPGDLYDFNDFAAQSVTQALFNGELHDDYTQTLVDHLQESQGAEHDLYEPLSGDDLPPEMKSAWALGAHADTDVWGRIPPADDRITFADPETVAEKWNEIVPTAYALWERTIENPRPIVETLGRRELDHVYDLAGYERGEDDDAARERIIDHCQAHGVGDDSLAEAFADYAVWNGKIPGETGAHLQAMLESAVDKDIPSMTEDSGNQPVWQFLTFERGFHPDTEIVEDGEMAKLTGDYKVDHVIYRSNLAEHGEDARKYPFVPAVRELSMWPTDGQGHPLHGGPYPVG